MKKHLFTAVTLILVLSLALSIPALAVGDADLSGDEIAAEETSDLPEETGKPEETPADAAAAEEEPADEKPAEEEPAKKDLRICINGEEVEFPTPATFIDSTTYVPLRAFAMAMGAKSVTWDGETGTAYVDTGKYTIAATRGGTEITANGRHFYAPTGNRASSGVFMVPLRTIASAFGADVLWAGELRTVYVTYTGAGIASGDEYYDSDELYWLAHIINAEARGESLEGKIAVGNVVMARVKSSYYPNSVYGVVFDGYQFSPAFDGSIYYTPSAESWLAAELVLDGAKVIPDCLFFAASYLNCWATYNRAYCTTIGGHTFYY